MVSRSSRTQDTYDEPRPGVSLRSASRVMNQWGRDSGYDWLLHSDAKGEVSPMKTGSLAPTALRHETSAALTGEKCNL